MAHRVGEASATAASAATTLEAPEVGGQHEENDGGGGSSNDLDFRQEQEGQQRPAQSESRGKENDGGRGGQPAPQPPPLSAAKGRGRRPGKRPAPFSSFVPKNAQGSGIKRRQLSPSTIQRNKAPTETKDDHDEKASLVNRVNHVPVDDVLGPNSNSMDLYADFLGAMDTSRAGQAATTLTSSSFRVKASAGAAQASSRESATSMSNFRSALSRGEGTGMSRSNGFMPSAAGTGQQRPRVALAEVARRHIPNWSLAQTMTIESNESDGLDWAERLWMPQDIVAGIRKAATGDNSDRDLLSLLSHFEYPASQGPSAADLNRLQSIVPANFKLHCQQRVDGSSDGPVEAGERSRGIGGIGSGGLQATTSITSQQGEGMQQDGGGPMGAGARGSRRHMGGDAGSGAGAAGSGEGHFLFDKRCKWGEAFKSVMSLLEQNKCPYFYVNDPDSGVIGLFMGRGQLGADPEAPVCAVFSQSSASLRSQLTRCQVKFECPLDSSLEKDMSTIDPELQDELRAYSRSASASRGAGATRSALLTRASSTIGSDDRLRSLLGFVGRQAVHGLFNVLMNRIVQRNGLHECPQLVSPVPFLHAMCQAPPRSVPRLVKIAHGREAREVDTLKLSGPTAAPQMAAILRAIANAVPNRRGQSLTVRLQADPNTHLFNEALHKMASRHGLGSGMAQPPLKFEVALNLGAARVEVSEL